VALAPRPADHTFDVAIIGSGAAGLTAALHLADGSQPPQPTILAAEPKR
jgi:glycine/D-amino acid oxidase-like deaminating enzyme